METVAQTVRHTILFQSVVMSQTWTARTWRSDILYPSNSSSRPVHGVRAYVVAHVGGATGEVVGALRKGRASERSRARHATVRADATRHSRDRGRSRCALVASAWATVASRTLSVSPSGICPLCCVKLIQPCSKWFDGCDCRTDRYV